MGRLAANVYVTLGDGTTKFLGAGSEPSAGEAALISNPKAWEGGEAPYDEEDERERHAADQAAAAAAEDEPPRRGPGSNKEAWTAYAAVVGVDVPEGTDRDGIVAAVDAHRQA